MNVAIVHDYLTQFGGAERVVLAIAGAFPGAPIYTSLYEPDSTFPQFRNCEIKASMLQRVIWLRRHHRLALPLLAMAFSKMRVEAEVAICSSSGWAHGAQVDGRKIVLCHTPARWLYQQDQYLRGSGTARRLVLRAIRNPLLEWDRRAAVSADKYLAVSTVVRDRIADSYGIEAEILHSPHAADTAAERRMPSGINGEFDLCVSRLLPYKNVDAVVRAYQLMPRSRLVVVGSGPEQKRLEALAGNNVTFLGEVADEQLWWLYSRCQVLVAASYEDFGLTPIEAAAFGRPSAVLRSGGYLDSVLEGKTGVFFDRAAPEEISQAVAEVKGRGWDSDVLRSQASRFSREAFVSKLKMLVAQVQ